VGNLTVGGAGKTPHIEYLIRFLNDYLKLSTVSRGYKRKTKGFLTVHPNNTAAQVGDEPLQFKRKFPDALVTVSESRTFAIPEIMKMAPDTQVVLLDDAFQHRAVQPGHNILLTEFDHLFTRDYLLPSGRLREWRSAYRRADVMIVSKCPPQLTPQQRADTLQELQPYPHQKVFFSYYDYHTPYFMLNSRYRAPLKSDWDVLLICAIARTDYLVDYLQENVNSVRVMEFEDHHEFTNYDIAQLKANFERMDSKKKIILTTEKDAMRLEQHRNYLVENQMPIFALPIEVKFHDDDRAGFESNIQNFLYNFKA
ncbi:MAG: tetraacyldisaccharide 4'-kinase, partial [Bacteroidota bacterium]